MNSVRCPEPAKYSSSPRGWIRDRQLGCIGVRPTHSQRARARVLRVIGPRPGKRRSRTSKLQIAGHLQQASGSCVHWTNGPVQASDIRAAIAAERLPSCEPAEDGCRRVEVESRLRRQRRVHKQLVVAAPDVAAVVDNHEVAAERAALDREGLHCHLRIGAAIAEMTVLGAQRAGNEVCGAPVVACPVDAERGVADRELVPGVACSHPEVAVVVDRVAGAVGCERRDIGVLHDLHSTAVVAPDRRTRDQRSRRRVAACHPHHEPVAAVSPEARVIDRGVGVDDPRARTNVLLEHRALDRR